MLFATSICMRDSLTSNSLLTTRYALVQRVTLWDTNFFPAACIRASVAFQDFETDETIL